MDWRDFALIAALVMAFGAFYNTLVIIEWFKKGKQWPFNLPTEKQK